jgi:proteasome lid subunit RPN8/RPN11
MEGTVPRNPDLHIPSALWRTLLSELHRRTRGCHESGAFLLGLNDGQGRRVEQIVYYDDLDPNAYETGVVVMHAASFGPLWDMCRARSLSVVADIHVHPEEAWQSFTDRDNPMIAQRGHLALIVPCFACPPISMETLGLFEYLGGHRWRNLSGRRISRFLQIV